MALNLPAGISLDQIPGLKPPSGVVPNFIDPESYQNSIIAILAICLTLATIVTVLRLYTKFFILKSIRLEDWFSCVAWLGFVAYVTLSATTLQYGCGIHQWDVPLSHVLQFARLASVVEIIYCPTIFAAKVAILLQISHIFVANRKSMRFYLVQFFIWSNALWYFTNILILTFQCTPQAKVWNPSLPGHCFIDFYQVNFIAMSFNIVSDIMIFILPMLWISKLQMSRDRKLGICFIFASGVFGCISSIMRLSFFLRWGKSLDITWYLAYDGNWALAEITSAIICGCLPVMPRAVTHFNAKVSGIVLSYRTSRAAKSGDSQVKISGRLGIKKSSAIGDHSDDYLELRDHNEPQSNRQTLKPSQSADLSKPGLMSTFSAV